MSNNANHANNGGNKNNNNLNKRKNQSQGPQSGDKSSSQNNTGQSSLSFKSFCTNQATIASDSEDVIITSTTSPPSKNLINKDQMLVYYFPFVKTIISCF